MASLEDRWWQSVTDAAGGSRKEQTDRHGSGKRWLVRWRDPDGKPRKQSFEKKTEALAYKANLESDLHRGAYTDPTATRETFDSFAASWLAARTSNPLTIEDTGNRLRRYVTGTPLGKTPLGRIRPSTVQSWLSGLELAPSTTRTVFDHVASILAAAVEDGILPRNPCQSSSVRPPKRPTRHVEPWTSERVAAMHAALPARYRPLVTLGAGLGLRPSEVFGLAVSDVDWLRGWVTVQRQVKIVRNRRVFDTTKSGPPRRVPLPESVKATLAAYLTEHPAVTVSLPWQEPEGKPVSAELLLTTERGRAIHARTIPGSVWYPALDRAGIPRGRENGQHALRHHYASVLLSAGESIRALAEYLGHRDAGFTLRTYSHLMPESETRTRAAIDLAFGQTFWGAPQVPQSGS